MRFQEPDDISDDEGEQGGIRLPPEAYEKQILSDTIDQLPLNTRTLLEVGKHYDKNLSRRQRRQIGIKLCILSDAFDALDPFNGVAFGDPRGYTPTPIPILRAKIPDPALHKEDTLGSKMPVKGWSTMRTLDRFLYRFEDYFEHNELIQGLTKSLSITICHVNRLQRHLALSERAALVIFFGTYPFPYNSLAYHESGHAKTRLDFVESHFEPLADDIAYFIKLTAAEIAQALAQCAVLKSYAELLSVPSSEVSRLPWQQQEHLKTYIALVHKEMDSRTRQYSLLLLFLVRLGMWREGFLEKGPGFFEGFGVMFQKVERIRGFMREVREWIAGGGRTGDLADLEGLARKRIEEGGWIWRREE